MTTQQIGTLAFNECCQRIMCSNANGYAKAYANAGLGMTDREEIRVQCLYILSNLSGWRGDEARMVKDTLKQFSKR